MGDSHFQDTFTPQLAGSPLHHQHPEGVAGVHTQPYARCAPVVSRCPEPTEWTGLGENRSLAPLCVREKLLFRPAGACPFPTFPHGLRRGLHSYAAARLNREALFHLVAENSSSHAHTLELVAFSLFPTACAVDFILTPLRGNKSADLCSTDSPRFEFSRAHQSCR
jgi:hypothetical protein